MEQVVYQFVIYHLSYVILLRHYGAPMKPPKKPVPSKVTLRTLMKQFDSETACREALEALRWPKGVICPRCQKKDVGKLPTRPVYYCRGCKYQFSVTAGTIVGDSHLPLTVWFYATALFVEAKKSMSALQLARTIGVTHKTAWYLWHRIRRAMLDTNPKPLHGVVEVDETYIGGKRKHVGRGYIGNKTMVLGALARGGDIRLRIEKRDDKATLQGFVAETVSPNVKQIYTDEHPGYQGIDDDAGDRGLHQTVNHRSEEYVRGDVHTNSVESAWSLLKRSIVGSFHRVSEKHLPAYLDEFEFRFNNRKNPYLFRDTLIKLIETPTFQYKELTARKTA
jgi:transposase-like protein